MCCVIPCKNRLLNSLQLCNTLNEYYFLCKYSARTKLWSAILLLSSDGLSDVRISMCYFSQNTCSKISNLRYYLKLLCICVMSGVRKLMKNKSCMFKGASSNHSLKTLQFNTDRHEIKDNAFIF